MNPNIYLKQATEEARLEWLDAKLNGNGDESSLWAIYHSLLLELYPL